MRCKEIDCDGEIDFGGIISLKAPVGPDYLFYPCKECSRLHWGSGKALKNKKDRRAFLKDGVIVWR
jgi:hypothetical protein